MTDNTVYEVIDRVDTPTGGPTSSFYEKTAATETTGTSTPSDTAYTVVDRLDTLAGSPTSSFYEKGSVYSDLVLSDSLLVQTQAARDAALVAQAASEAAAASIVPTVNAAVLVETNARIAADALKANLASPGFSGVPTAPTAAPGVNTTQLATTAFATAADTALQGTINTALALKAPLASPALTGVPVAPTAGAGTNTTQIATTAFTQAAIAALVASAPATLDTLNKLALALGNDPSFATTMATALGLKAPLASPGFSGTPTAPTAPAGTNTTQVATTAFVEAARVILAAAAALKAPLASPALTGIPTAPTAAPGTNTTQLATTAYAAALGDLKANLASPTFTGVPSGPTAAPATNTTQLATTAFVLANSAASGVTSIAGNTGAFTLGSGLTNTVNSLAVSQTFFQNVLTADVAVNVINTNFAGPVIAQGTVGTWDVSGQITCLDTGSGIWYARLWDGTNTYASGAFNMTGRCTISLSAIVTNPLGNLRIDVQNVNTATGSIKFNTTGSSKDSLIKAHRIA